MIEQKKIKQRLKLSFDQTLTHYIVVLFLLFYSGLIFWSLHDTDIDLTQKSELIILSVIFFILAIIFAFIQYQRLYLTEIKINYTEEQFQEAVKNVVADLNWRIENNNKKLFKAYIPTVFQGYTLTVIKYKDRLLINSIGNLSSRMPPLLSFKRNERNIKTFIKFLIDIIQGKYIEPPKEITTKNEWSAKMILIRLFAYPFSLILIGLGIYTILIRLSMVTFIVGLGVIIIATIYLYSDLKILTRKKKQEKP